MEHPESYKGQQVIILGLARSGLAVAKLFHEYGAHVTVNDRKPREECAEAGELEALGMRVVCGYHPDDLISEDVSLIVKNPGIPYSIEPLRIADELGIEIVTEVEVASRLTDVPIIGITGSNGKTTTTTWAGEILSAAAMKPVVAGNIGRALCEAVTEERQTDPNWYVTELSSFQLKGTDRFRPKIACLLNFSETHLDYHGTLDDYWNSKKKLFLNQTAEDYAILNKDDPYCRQLAEELKAKIMYISMSALESEHHGVFVDEEMIVYRDQQGNRHEVVSTREIGIPGSFNIENALAATAISLLAGAPLEVIARILREFRGVAHRLEFVAEYNGVKYYNNSKATNASAAQKALEAIEASVVLIAGGQDRGSEYMDLLPVFRERVKGLVLLGETREKLRRIGEQAGISEITLIDAGEDAEAMLRQAVERAAAIASPGDVVMLNPACASWDMFPSFEERGRMFKESVHNLE